jgi:hypothetical protein
MCIHTHTHTHIYIYIYIGQFISPSSISDLCGTVARMVTPKGSMSTEGEILQVSVLSYRCSIHPLLVTRQMSILQTSSCHTRCHTTATTKDSGGSRCNVCGRNLITGLTSAASPRVDISSTCKVGQKLGTSFPLLTCSPSA